jgi:hypothetical protein
VHDEFRSFLVCWLFKDVLSEADIMEIHVWWVLFVFKESARVATLVGCLKVKVKVKVMCTLVQALRLCTGRTAHRERRGIALPFHDHGTRRG